MKKSLGDDRFEVYDTLATCGIWDHDTMAKLLRSGSGRRLARGKLRAQIPSRGGQKRSPIIGMVISTGVLQVLLQFSSLN